MRRPFAKRLGGYPPYRFEPCAYRFGEMAERSNAPALNTGDRKDPQVRILLSSLSPCTETVNRPVWNTGGLRTLGFKSPRGRICLWCNGSAAGSNPAGVGSIPTRYALACWLNGTAPASKADRSERISEFESPARRKFFGDLMKNRKIRLAQIHNR